MPFPVNVDIADVTRVTPAKMKLVAPVTSVNDLTGRMQRLTATEKVTLSGRRGSQGGQCLLDGAVALDLDLLQSVSLHESTDAAGQPVATARVGAGAQWNHLHQALAHGRAVDEHLQPITRLAGCWAPRVHQSSPSFSVGGSLAVNCHGRDPRQPPVAGTVLALDVLTGQGQHHANLKPGDPLFHAVLGGYGAAGIILSATLSLKPEQQLRHEVAVRDLLPHLEKLKARIDQPDTWPAMHYGFLRFDRGDRLFQEVIAVDSWDDGPVDPSEALQNETFLTDDAAALLYQELRKNPDHPAFWEVLKLQQASLHGQRQRTLNAMRAPVRFTHLEGHTTADFLQEYFLPVECLDDFLAFARNEFNERVPASVKLLSATLRVVQQDTTSLLSYSATGPRVSVVFNMNAPQRDQRDPPPGRGLSAVANWTRPLIDKALGLSGSFYLPYARCASLDQFQRAYPRWAELHALRREHDPELRLDNRFLQAYGL